MIKGSRTIPKPLPVITEKLKCILAGANYEIVDASDGRLRFRHGTYLTQTASLLPKTGTIELHDHGDSTNVVYSIDTSGPAKWWLLFPALGGPCLQRTIARFGRQKLKDPER